jgi:carboxymethylenebutenolidase
MGAGSRINLPATGAAPASEAYAAVPERAARGMVVIHESLGPQPEIDRVVERFAGRGYAAIAPTLFHTPLNPVCVRRAMQTVSTGKGPYVDQLRGARAWLCEQAGIPEKRVGLLGLCMGGGFALAAGSGWAAVSTNYGDIPKPELMKGIGPVIGCYGGRDRIYGGSARKLEQTLRPLGVEVETHTYPDVGHSFLTDGHHPIAFALSAPLFHITWNASVAEEAWTRIFAFMDRHLAA